MSGAARGVKRVRITNICEIQHAAVNRVNCPVSDRSGPYLIFVISFTLAGFFNPNILHPKITKNTQKLKQIDPKSVKYAIFFFWFLCPGDYPTPLPIPPAFWLPLHLVVYLLHHPCFSRDLNFRKYLNLLLISSHLRLLH